MLGSPLNWQQNILLQVWPFQKKPDQFWIIQKSGLTTANLVIWLTVNRNWLCMSNFTFHDKLDEIKSVLLFSLLQHLLYMGAKVKKNVSLRMAWKKYIFHLYHIIFSILYAKYSRMASELIILKLCSRELLAFLKSSHEYRRFKFLSLAFYSVSIFYASFFLQYQFR